MSETKEITLEELQNIQTDPDIETRIAQSLGIPAGVYNSVPELSLILRVAAEGTMHPGRQSARFYGLFEGQAGGDELLAPRGYAGFDVSWEYRDRVDFESRSVLAGRPDNLSKLWYQACRAFRQANEIAPKTVVRVAEVLEYLQKYPVAVRFIYLAGRDDPLAVAISRAKGEV